MNPLILRTKAEIERALSTHSQDADGQWSLAIPLHNFRDRLMAVVHVLQGEALVVYLRGEDPFRVGLGADDGP